MSDTEPEEGFRSGLPPAELEPLDTSFGWRDRLAAARKYIGSMVADKNGDADEAPKPDYDAPTIVGDPMNPFADMPGKARDSAKKHMDAFAKKDGPKDEPKDEPEAEIEAIGIEIGGGGGASPALKGDLEALKESHPDLASHIDAIIKAL